VVLLMRNVLNTAVLVVAMGFLVPGLRVLAAQDRHAFVPMDLKQMFTAGPLSDPQPPSTLLPAGATTVEFALHASEPTSCRYCIGRSRPLSKMTPFDDQQPSTSPKTVIRGLNPDPAVVNDVYIRCTTAPDAVLHLQYRCPPPSPAFHASPISGGRGISSPREWRTPRASTYGWGRVSTPIKSESFAG
jgi:hypothetical protein